ncbi:MAG: fumarylacetoacetate hydrolase family protein [Xanthobacteraceae bacterium]|nr:fumarylacetoacetate hydrolase family protein [Xanthobacteraceae bacterium]
MLTAVTPAIQATAEALRTARQSLKPVAPVRETHALEGADAAYAVQELNTAFYLKSGRRLVGRKIGLTAKAVQAQLGVDEPDYGMIWGDLAFAPGDAIPATRFMQPKLEAEIAFIIGKDLTSPDLTFPDVLRAVDCALPALEIVDSAIADWKIKLVDTIADNASGGGYVLGDSPRSIGDADLRLCGMVLSRNGATESLGIGAACLGHPLQAVLWLARKMVDVGRPLKAGDVVLSGALGPMVPVRGGDHFNVEIQGFSPFSVSFVS